MFSQTCLIHRVRFYYPPSCAYALLSYSPVLGFRVNQEKGTSDRRRKQRSEKQPPPPLPPLQPQTHSSAHRLDVRSCVRACVCVLFLAAAAAPKVAYLRSYDWPSPSSHWIGRIERRARAPPPRREEGSGDDVLSFFFFYAPSGGLPLVAWCSVCVLYVCVAFPDSNTSCLSSRCGR